MILGLSDEVQLAIVGAFVTIATGVTTVLTAWLNTRAMRKETAPVKEALAQQNITSAQRKFETDEKLSEVTHQVKKIGEQTNSMKDELVAKAEEVGRAAGIAHVQEVVASNELADKVAEKVFTKIETNLPAPPSGA